MVMEGEDCERLNSIQDCEYGAEFLGLPDTSCLPFADPRYPPYCYYKNVTDRAGRKGLKFNMAPDRGMAPDVSVPCSHLRPCLCQMSSEHRYRRERNLSWIFPSNMLHISYLALTSVRKTGRHHFFTPKISLFHKYKKNNTNFCI